MSVSQTARPAPDRGSYAMCYAISTGDDSFAPYFRYEFVQPLFRDNPRPAVWPDGYYAPTSPSVDRIQKHACVVDRARLLQEESATEQCVIVDVIKFLNNADLNGTQLPPTGAPNIMLAAGGGQLKGVLRDDGLYAWTFHVDWKTPANTRVEGPTRIAVAPYEYLCRGQLTNCVPQAGDERKLDAQGDKHLARVGYRRIGSREMIVAMHSVNTAANGDVRWHEFTVNRTPNAAPVTLRQQGTVVFDGSFR